MEISSEARIMIGLMLLSITTIEFGGYFLLSELRRSSGNVITSEIMGSYFRAGHAHAGVLVILGLIGQLVIDASALNTGLEWAVRIGLVAAPILISAGFFLGAPLEGRTPRRPIMLVSIGALMLALCLVVLGLGLLFA
jgi:Ni,Fe-hydrogenase I cytochrome b subunit